MNNFLIGLFAAMGSAFVSSTIFTEIDKKYKLSNWVKIKLHINNKFKDILFFVLTNTLVSAATLRLTSSTNVYYYAIEGFFFGILLCFIM